MEKGAGLVGDADNEDRVRGCVESIHLPPFVSFGEATKPDRGVV